MTPFLPQPFMPHVQKYMPSVTYTLMRLAGVRTNQEIPSPVTWNGLVSLVDDLHERKGENAALDHIRAMHVTDSSGLKINGLTFDILLADAQYRSKIHTILHIDPSCMFFGVLPKKNDFGMIDVQMVLWPHKGRSIPALWERMLEHPPTANAVSFSLKAAQMFFQPQDAVQRKISAWIDQANNIAQRPQSLICPEVQEEGQIILH